MNLHIRPEALLFLPVIILSLSLHEAGHAFVAWKGGDDTAARQGRLSINPLVHLDPMGTAVILFQVFFSVPLIGWAKPVPVTPALLKNARWNVWVALGGVAVNAMIVIVSLVFLKIFLLLGWLELIAQGNLYWGLFMILRASVMINTCLIVFNLIPVPPLDGSHVFFYFIRTRASLAFKVFEFLEQYGFMILLMLVMFTDAIGYLLFPALAVVAFFSELLLGIPSGLVSY